MANLVITITVPDIDKARVVDGISQRTGWTSMIDGPLETRIPNPIDQETHIRNYLLSHLQKLIIRDEADVAKRNKDAASTTEVGAISMTVV